MTRAEKHRRWNREYMRRLRRDPATAKKLRAAARAYQQRPEVRERQRARRQAAWFRDVKKRKARIERQRKAEIRRLAREAQQARQHEAYERERLAQMANPKYAPERLLCECGSALLFGTDGFGHAVQWCGHCQRAQFIHRHAA